MEYNKNDNDMVEIIQPTKNAKGKRNKIIDELIWTKETKLIEESHQLGASTQCKENNDCYV